MGETRVDLVHLLEDLADAYPGDLDETVLTEIVANALDSGATTIALTADPATATLTVIDDGQGMRRAELRRYHDVAASAKARGDGIGFAGVGIKLGLLAGDVVLTESRRGKDHVSTMWALAGRKRAPWRWISPLGLVGDHGTAVRLTLRNALSPLLDGGYLETVLREHFEPLLDAYFDDILAAQYPHGIRFLINGAAVDRTPAEHRGTETADLAVRLARKRKPSAVGYLVREPFAFPDARRGIAISTFGKVIKRGWDWLGVSPTAPDRISGLIEVPALASCLTMNKVDFLRAGPRGATYLAYRKALQEAVTRELARWGDAPTGDEQRRRRAARPVERDLESVLIDLAGDFPMLAMLVERRAGGTRMLPGGDGTVEPRDLDRETIELFPASVDGDAPAPAPAHDREPEQAGEGEPEALAVEDQQPAPGAGDQDSSPPTEMPRPGRGRRPARLGLTIQFESRPGDRALARLVETTVWVNETHGAYRRAVASRSEGYHLALSVALALADVAVEPADELAFITEFMARWGESTGQKGDGRSRPRRRAPTRR